MTLAQYDSTHTLPPGAIAAVAGFYLVFGFIALVFWVFSVYCYYRIAGKAGFSPWLGLIALIPLGSFILLVVFAFADWPALRGGPSSGTFTTVGTDDASSGYLPGRGPGSITPS